MRRDGGGGPTVLMLSSTYSYCTWQPGEAAALPPRECCERIYVQTTGVTERRRRDRQRAGSLCNVLISAREGGARCAAHGGGGAAVRASYISYAQDQCVHAHHMDHHHVHASRD